MYGDTYHCLIVAVLDHRLYEAGIMHAFFFFLITVFQVPTIVPGT